MKVSNFFVFNCSATSLKLVKTTIWCIVFMLISSVYQLSYGINDYSYRSAKSKKNKTTKIESKTNGNQSNVADGSKNNGISVQSNNDYTTLYIPLLNNKTKTAIFIRNSKLWIVLDQVLENIAIKNNLVENLANSKISNIEQLHLNPKASFFIADIKMKDNDKIYLHKQDNILILNISSKNNGSNTNEIFKLLLNIYPNQIKQPKVNINFQETIQNDIIEYVDPFIGDKVILVPTYKQNITDNNYFFIDFQVLKSIQGLVILPLSDKLEYSIKDQVLTITSSDGLNISPKVYSSDQQYSQQNPFSILSNYDKGNSMLSLTGFLANPEDLNYKFADLSNKMNQSKISNKPNLWANLALLYLANGFYKEAINSVDMAYYYDPSFLNNYIIQLLKAVAEFMDGKYHKAYNTINSIKVESTKLNNREEIRFWQALIYLKFIKETPGIDSSYDYVANSSLIHIFNNNKKNFLQYYPRDFLLKIGFTLIESKLDSESLIEVEKIFKTISDLKILSKTANYNYLQYLIANFYNKQEEYDKAVKILNKCIEEAELTTPYDSKNYALCNLAKTKVLYKDEKIKLQDYTSALERIEMIWRGDKIELETLKLLGDAYYNDNNYIQTLRVWKSIINNFPDSVDSLKFTNKMGAAFINFFTNKFSDNSTPLEALSFFYEFGNFIPVGSIGDDIIIKAADYLIELDLLEKAEALLEHQVKNRLYGYKRDKSINTLARVYLDNNKPKQAIELIEYAGNYKSDNLSKIAKERKHLYAKALLQIKQYSKVMEALKNDYSQNSDDIKAEAYWIEKKWRKFDDYSEPYIYSIRNSDDIISNDEARRILKQSISYEMSKNNKLFHQLYEDFNERFPDSTYGKIAKVLYDFKNVKSEDNINGMQDINKLTSILDNARDTIL